ncbi:MAG: sigma-70 family RNA polymerase sigma factor [Bacteroidota bacterium]|nr:sigma-70 family RNA polymerase sigma factor [Candidatus Kapabacteria bacterium]MCX7936741.1 sigma-70 family RNA polymerase sigma factor [Chlorobiota bacterium]MDW8074215.1 sigma-70 family RNA polymerase sigma factor [Bacteroidota bacterium]MDW8271309.1 sigma-70 family RNA polymerase sigma factor [Bacteroidota bacterium]
MDEQTLIALLLERKEEGFRELMRVYKDDLVNYAYRFIGSYDDAVDVAQETFIRVFRFIDTFQQGARLRTWLYAIARNVAFSILDERKRHGTISMIDTDEEGHEVEYEAPDLTYTPDRSVDSTLIAQQIQQALMRLPPAFREAVVLRDIEGLSYEEIAEVCKTELGTVKSRINRGRAMLQELLRDLYQELFGEQ